MSAEETKKQPPLLGLLWPWEVPLLAVMVYGLVYETDSKLRGASGTVAWFGAAILAGVVMLILRCPDEWRRLPNRAFFFILTAAWVALFTFLGNSTFGYINTHSLFSWLFDIYTAPDSEAEFALLMPFVVLALFWWKRRELVAEPPALWAPAIWLVVAGLLAHVLGYITQHPQVSLVGFLTGLYGFTGLAWGKNWLKRSFFPFFLLAFCIPMGGTDWLTLRMRLLVAWIVAGIAHLGLSPDLVRDGTQLLDANHTFAYEVAAACSGIRSLTALLALTTIYGFICFKAPWKRGVMILSAFPLAIFGNVLRLCFTIMVAELGGQSAGKAVETNAGFITFAVAIACVYFLGRWLDRFGPASPESEPPALAPVQKTAGRSGPVFAGLMLALMGLTAVLIFHITAQQRLGEPGVKTRPIAGSQRLEVLMPPTIPGYTSEILTNGETVLANQLPKDSSYRSLIYTGDDRFQVEMTTVLMGTDRTSIHSPYICLVGQGWGIDNRHTIVDSIHMERPLAYDLSVNKMLATKQFTDANGNTRTYRGIYVYWYVDGSQLTTNDKLWAWWLMPRELLLHNVMERWSYVSVFAACPPDQEAAAYDRMKKLIATAVPEFQLVPKGGG